MREYKKKCPQFNHLFGNIKIIYNKLNKLTQYLVQNK